MSGSSLDTTFCTYEYLDALMNPNDPFRETFFPRCNSILIAMQFKHNHFKMVPPSINRVSGYPFSPYFISYPLKKEVFGSHVGKEYFTMMAHLYDSLNLVCYRDTITYMNNEKNMLNCLSQQSSQAKNLYYQYSRPFNHQNWYLEQQRQQQEQYWYQEQMQDYNQTQYREQRQDHRQVQYQEQKQQHLQTQYQEQKQQHLQTQYQEQKQQHLQAQYQEQKQQHLQAQYQEQKQQHLQAQYQEQKQQHLQAQYQEQKQQHLQPQYQEQKQQHLQAQYQEQKQQHLQAQYQEQKQQHLQPQYQEQKQQHLQAQYQEQKQQHLQAQYQEQKQDHHEANTKSRSRNTTRHSTDIRSRNIDSTKNSSGNIVSSKQQQEYRKYNEQHQERCQEEQKLSYQQLLRRERMLQEFHRQFLPREYSGYQQILQMLQMLHSEGEKQRERDQNVDKTILKEREEFTYGIVHSDSLTETAKRRLIFQK
ncbi:transcription factor SPT20 homolog isoform X1 [Palaemon carinicauda]|uniref:transcription factor SPT20 homolog isoform X1 n=2 Tax=Palaemon carinicauda TaxID=392227 RepID=UPI0035B60C15